MKLSTPPSVQYFPTSAIPLLFIIVLILLVILIGCQGKPGSELETAVVDPLDNYLDWGIYRGDKKGNQYSELNQINRNNVGALEIAWQYHHGNPSSPSMYSNAIMIDDILYFTAPSLDVIAINAKNGEEIWRFVVAVHNETGTETSGRNRGVAYWTDGAYGRIFAFVKNRIYALDAKTGLHIKSFGEHGYIDLNYHLPIDPNTASVEMTSPGILYKDHLIVGGRVPEGYNSTPGDVRSYNAITGEFEWIFHTVPRPGEEGYNTWEFEEGETYGGANPWGGFTMDQERGWVFFATGSPAPDFIYGGTRKGTNLFGNCIIALDAETGMKIWHYQNIHHDIFDYDNPPAPILSTISTGEKQQDVVVQFTKMGLTFILDRQTGIPVFPTPEVPVPQTDIPEEESWPTQPIPERPPPLVRTHITEGELTDLSPESHEFALNLFRKYHSGPLYTPSNEQGVITAPGHQGGNEWGGGAYNPNTNIMFVNANEAPTINRLLKFYDDDGDGTPELKGATVYYKNCSSCHGINRQGIPASIPPLTAIPLNPLEIQAVIQQGRGNMPAFPQLEEGKLSDLIAYLTSTPKEFQELSSVGKIKYSSDAPFFNDGEGFPGIKPPWGTLNAMNIATGTIEWKVPLGEYESLKQRGILNTGTRNFGGPIATAGGLVFIAGTPDEKIRAFDQTDGRLLWEHELPAAAFATPSTYMIDGIQYLVIVCGGGGKLKTTLGDAVVAFAINSD
jgi:quinoprotein glucose dehydrogenase